MTSTRAARAAGSSGRTREFGIRRAIGSQPRHLVAGVLTEGAIMAMAGVIAGAMCGFALARLAGTYFQDMRPAWGITSGTSDFRTEQARQTRDALQYVRVRLTIQLLRARNTRQDADHTTQPRIIASL